MTMKLTMLMIVGALLLGCLTTSTTLAAPVGEQQQQSDDSVDVNQLIEEVQTTANEAGTASNILYRYIEDELLPEREESQQAPCFIRERSQGEVESSPQNNYRQLLLEDHQSAVNYVDYIRRVEEQYNDTMNANPGCGYCTRFMDTKRKMEQLLTTLDALVEAVNATASQSSDSSSQDQGAGDSNAQGGGDLTNDEDPTPTSTSPTSSPTSTASQVPEYCSNLCPEQQVEIFMRMSLFASVYVWIDMIGLADQLKD